MKLIFLYVQARNGKFYAERVREEGYFHLIERMVATGIVDEALIVIDTPQAGADVYGPGLYGLRTPDISNIFDVMAPGDVIWCRGGFRAWHNVLHDAGRLGYRLMVYAANTGRERWRFWDVVLDDLAGRDFVDGAGRVHLDFRKPVHERLFYYDERYPRYDLCIGASHIWDKKGQWRVMEAVAAYRDMFGDKLSCIMPGGVRGGVKTRAMIEWIRNHDPDIEMPGMVSRRDLNRIYNLSKIFVHIGHHGQGDRGPMEAMRCGCKLIIGYPRYHAPWVCEHSAVTRVPADPNDIEELAHIIHSLKYAGSVATRADAHEYQRLQAGVENTALPRMAQIFDVFRKNPRADREALKEAFAL